MLMAAAFIAAGCQKNPENSARSYANTNGNYNNYNTNYSSGTNAP